MKLTSLLYEIAFDTYETVVRVKYGQEGLTKYDQALRALPGVTTVTVLSTDSDNNLGTYKIKLITQRTPKDAFDAFVKNAKDKYSNVVEVEYDENMIEKA